MPQTLGDIDRPSVFVVEQDGVPMTECRRSHPNIDHHIEHRTVHAGHIFGLARRHLREVQPAQHARRGCRAVGLPEVEMVAREFAEFAVGKPLEEDAARIAVDGRGDLPGSGDLEFTYPHVTDRVLRNELRRRPSVAATTIRWHDTSRWSPATPSQSRCALAPNTIRCTA